MTHAIAWLCVIAATVFGVAALLWAWGMAYSLRNEPFVAFWWLG